MEEDYLIRDVSPEEYQKLRKIGKKLLRAAKNDFNEFNATFWKPRIKGISPKIGYMQGCSMAYINFGTDNGPRIFFKSRDFTEEEGLVAWNMRYQIKKSLEKMREEEEKDVFYWV